MTQMSDTFHENDSRVAMMAPPVEIIPASLDGPDVATAGRWEPLSIWYFRAHPRDEFVMQNYWDPAAAPSGSEWIN